MIPVAKPKGVKDARWHELITDQLRGNELRAITRCGIVVEKHWRTRPAVPEDIIDCVRCIILRRDGKVEEAKQ